MLRILECLAVFRQRAAPSFHTRSIPFVRHFVGIKPIGTEIDAMTWTSVLQPILRPHPELSGWNQPHPFRLGNATLNQLLQFIVLCRPKLVIHPRDRLLVLRT